MFYTGGVNNLLTFNAHAHTLGKTCTLHNVFFPSLTLPYRESRVHGKIRDSSLVVPFDSGRDHPLWPNSVYMYIDKTFKLLHKLIYINPFTAFKAQKHSSFFIRVYTCNMDV